MAYFMTRVELHGANGSDYEKLHEVMQAASFSRMIKGNDGTTYNLPTAEYVMIGDYDFDSVLKTAKHAADKINKNNMVIIAKADSLKWNYS